MVLILHVDKIRHMVSAKEDTLTSGNPELMSDSSQAWCCVITSVLFYLFPVILPVKVLYNPLELCGKKKKFSSLTFTSDR